MKTYLQIKSEIARARSLEKRAQRQVGIQVRRQMKLADDAKDALWRIRVKQLETRIDRQRKTSKKRKSR